MSNSNLKICDWIDNCLKSIGKFFSWFNILLIAVIIFQVLMRYLFSSGFAVLEEIQFHLYGVMLIVALSYTYVSNSHIRLDLFHARFSFARKEMVEIFGILFLLVPMIIVIFLNSIDFLSESWRVNERSDAPMGLCCRWAFKAFIPIGMMLLFTACVSRLIRALASLKGSRSKERTNGH